MMKLGNDLILELYDIEAVKFGNFKLKSGIESPIYIDLRSMISYPQLLKAISDMVWDCMHRCDFDLICGVPYTALPIAVTVSIKYDIPMLIVRKETKKEHGINRCVEGVYSSNQICVLIEDVITSGSSVLETIYKLKEVGVQVRDVIAVVDRCQGGKQAIMKSGCNVYSLFCIDEMVETLHHGKGLDSDIVSQVKSFINNNRF